MDIYTATMIAEGVDDTDIPTQIEAWQLLVDTGTAWELQGYFGRTAEAMIERGIIQPCPRPSHHNETHTGACDADH